MSWKRLHVETSSHLCDWSDSKVCGPGVALSVMIATVYGHQITIQSDYMTHILHALVLLAIPLSQHRFGEVLIRLPHAQIRQNLLCTSENRIELVRAMELLNYATHA